jgi:DNA topoisomerase-1
MLTSNFTRTKPTKAGSWLLTINGKPASDEMQRLRIPPAWTNVTVDPAPGAVIVAIGFDATGRKQRLYSPLHIAEAKAGKFERVRALLGEWDDIQTQIESDLNDRLAPQGTKEAVLMAYLIYETGIRPGSETSARGDNSQAGTATFGASTLQLRHVKACTRGVRLKFVGKKGVSQNILVTNPYLVRIFLQRKRDTTAWTTPLFRYGAGYLRAYFKSLGSGGYTPKDFRTARGTKLALELLGSRQRLPKAKSRRKKIINAALDRVAKMLGNTRAVSRSAYVDPAILERFI